MKRILVFLLMVAFTGIIFEPEASPKADTKITSVTPIKTTLPRPSFRLERLKKESAIEIEVTVTAYTSNPGDETFSGTEPGPGTIAVDPKFIDFWSVVSFPGVTFESLPASQKYFTAVDTGRKIKGWKIDVWMPSKKEANDFGIQKLQIKIKKPLAG